ncbi:ARM repeat-containing protein [Aulographum hederae CBS 113979]|uniref:ARM repeat-containing protein n=1 Tax=Aulographum hederae CBS 113979 TaxID=1176131 RepID=A0A6G1HBN2_9PEZI|nr:ARM repeat-containing protein [Aulographum hederae CBS 113979]
MARTLLPPSLDELRSPTSQASQITALKQLKNELVGHEQRKQLVVQHGVVPELVRILDTSGKREGKRRTKEGGVSIVDGPALDEKPEDSNWSGEEELRLQATLVVGSLAHGGLAYITPLIAGGIVPPLLSALSYTDIASKTMLWTLRSLLVMAEALAADMQSLAQSSTNTFAEQLFVRPVVDSLADILSDKSSSPVAEERICLVAQLIKHSCKAPQHQALLVKAGILDLLAARLAAIAVAIGYGPTSDASSDLPHPLQPSKLVFLLDAIAAIIQGSSYRCARFLYAPSVLAVFPLFDNQNSSSEQFFAKLRDEAAAEAQTQSPLELLLPQLHALQTKSELSFSRSFPSLSPPAGEFSRTPFFPNSGNLNPHSGKTISVDEFGSPLIAWLIHLARTMNGSDRLSAAWLLTLLIRALDRHALDIWNDPSRNRDRTLALLVAPLIVKMIDEAMADSKALSGLTPAQQLSVRRTKELAPLSLAMLIEDNLPLQRAAVDAGAIKILSQILKKTFDPVTVTSKSMWSPIPRSSQTMESTMDSPSCEIGKPGLLPEAIHAFKCRAAAMEALSAIAQKEDTYRKSIIDQGIVTCVVDSLVPQTDGPSLDGAVRPPSNDKEGNPVSVIVAACNLSRALSRSVNVLRTSLIDGGIAKPIFNLLTHPNMEVQLAATDVVCNLVLTFSPMRDDLMRSGVMNVLCEHAHSAEPRMQIISLWALKHLMDNASNDVKISCLEELGTGWLIQKIGGDLRDTGARVTTPIGMGTPNAAGEQVDLLNAEEPTMELDGDSIMSDYEDPEAMADSLDSLSLPRYSRRTPPPRHHNRLKAIKNAEQSASARSYKNDIRIQEQALDFIRNTITNTGPGIESAQIIDHILHTLNRDRLFEILISKLKPRSSGPTLSTPITPHGKRPTLTTPASSAYSNQNTSSNNPPPHHQSSAISAQFAREATYTYTYPPEILKSSLMVLLSIANGTPHHRTLLLDAPNLVTSILPLFAHPAREIRVTCCWLVLNLTWIENGGDAIPARERAMFLRRAGVEERVRCLMLDQDRDVMERAKAAGESFVKLCGSLGGDDGEGGGRDGLGMYGGHRRDGRGMRV